MLLQVAAFIAGLAGLYYGAEWLVRGSARLARSFGISALVVGLTVVAFGTSAPELVVSVVATVRDQSGVAIGNVVGSNIANIGLILGLAALISGMRVQMRLLTREMPVMLLATVAFLVFAYDGELSRIDGALLLVGFVGYMMMMLRAARIEPTLIEAEFEGFEQAERMVDPDSSHRLRNTLLLIAGLIVLAAGAQLLVGSAVFFARALGISELVIGLTVVAVGTSLPELATSAIAAFRGEADIAIGNIVGSNIFNILLILGVAPLVRPMTVDGALFSFEIPVMVALALVLPLLGRTGLRVVRWEGLFLLLSYLAFTVALLARAGVL
jgi:cation:H+ antiporter